MNISIGLIVSYSFIVLVYILALFYFYSYYFYNKNLLFTKIKINFISAFIALIILLCFLGMGIYSSLNLSLKLSANWQEERINNILNVSFSWIIFLFALAHTLYAFLLPTWLNKEKISFTKVKEYDFISLKEKLKTEININEVETILKNKHQRYFSKLEEQRNYIIQTINKGDFIYQDVLASIVCFNEEFTTKWSKPINTYQKIALCDLMIQFLTKI